MASVGPRLIRWRPSVNIATPRGVMGPGGGQVSAPAPPGPVTERVPEHTVVVPFVRGMLHPTTKWVMDLYEGTVEYLELPKTDDTAYARWFVSMWGRMQTFIVVEQDMMPPPGSLRSLVTCEEPWCVHAYNVAGAEYVGALGLAKFSQTIMSACPLLATLLLYRSSNPPRWVHWRSVADYLGRGLQQCGYTPHIHHPAAIHLHDYTDGGR